MSTFRSSATVRPVLRELNQLLRATVNGEQKDLRKPWWDQIREWQQAHPLTYHQEKDGPIKPQQVVKRLYELTRDRDPIVVDGCRTAPNVGRAVFQVGKSESVVDIGRAWHDGFWIPCRHGRASRLSGIDWSCALRETAAFR